ncbi:MAG TPA: tetratricopeptide repeat protein [Geomonas sp.]
MTERPAGTPRGTVKFPAEPPNPAKSGLAPLVTPGAVVRHTFCLTPSMTFTLRTAYPGRHLWLCIVLLLGCALPGRAEAQAENRLRRIQIRPHQGFTRITLLFQAAPDFTLTRFPGRIRLSFRETDAPAFRKFRSYADAHVGGLFCSLRNGGLQVEVPVKEAGAGVQLLSYGDPSALALDIGPAMRRPQRVDIAPGREPILSGTEQFVREFGTPARAGLPFVPTEVKKLQGLLPEGEVLLFQRGEGALYKEQGTEAVEIFSYFLAKSPAVRALASYRLAQALYLLERYDESLKAFRQGEGLWPDYLNQAPELMQSYADVRARSGDFAGGRALLVLLIERLAGTDYAAPLLNRLADMSARHGESALALGIYRSVVVHAPRTTAAGRARIKLADQEMFSLSRDRYRTLLQRYQSIYEAPGDFDLRDEALFKMALLQALYGPAREALAAAITYERRYPRGIFATIVKKMREELLLPVYREIYAERDDAALVRLAQDNREYLARCFSDPEFAGRVAQACRGAGMLNQEFSLFGYLADRNWAASAAPFMAARVVEDALALGNLPLAESVARGFLARFPRDARVQRIHEELGRIAFERGGLKGVISELSFLNAGGRKPEIPESDYYLGKALAGAGENRGAERALARFIKGARRESPLLPDAYFAVAGARVALRDYAGALAAYQQGGKVASGETADQFLYKTGELYLQLKMVREAAAAWEQVAKRGDGTWGKLAAESLSDLRWRLKIARELR